VFSRSVCSLARQTIVSKQLLSPTGNGGVAGLQPFWQEDAASRQLQPLLSRLCAQYVSVARLLPALPLTALASVCDRYLLQEKRGKGAADPVAKYAAPVAGSCC
jgi:hypothetical protein